MSQNLARGNHLARVRTEYCIRLLQGWLRRQMHRIREANRIRRDHKYLSELSDEMLADVGLTPFDIDKARHRRVPPNLGVYGMHLW